MFCCWQFISLSEKVCPYTSFDCFRLIYDSADESKDSADVPMLGATNDSPAPADTSTQIEITTQEQQASATTFQAFIEFLSFPGIWAVSLIFPLFGVPFGLLDVSLSPYLLEHFGVDGDTAGLYFLSLGAMYAICTQFTGYITDKGKHGFLSLKRLSAFEKRTLKYKIRRNRIDKIKKITKKIYNKSRIETIP